MKIKTLPVIISFVLSIFITSCSDTLWDLVERDSRPDQGVYNVNVIEINKIRIDFDYAVDKETAENIENYIVSDTDSGDEILIYSAEQDVEKPERVYLHTDFLDDYSSYAVTIKNINSEEAQPISATGIYKDFVTADFSDNILPKIESFALKSNEDVAAQWIEGEWTFETTESIYPVNGFTARFSEAMDRITVEAALGFYVRGEKLTPSEILWSNFNQDVIFSFTDVKIRSEAYVVLTDDARDGRANPLMNPVRNIEFFVGSPDSADDNEPDDSFNDASDIGTNSIYEGNISTSSDVDFYKISLTSTKDYSFILSSLPEGADYGIEIFSAPVNDPQYIVATGQAPGAELVNYTAKQTTAHYIKVFSQSGSSATDSYWIYVYETDRYEWNNSLSTAAQIDTDFNVEGTIHVESDVDCFKVNLSSLYNYNIVLDDVPNGLEYDLKLYSGKDESNLIAVSNTIGNENYEFAPYKPGVNTYYVKVFSSNKASVSSSYILSINQGNTVGDDYETNNNFGEATAISVDGEIELTIHNLYDKDFFSAVLSDANQYTVSISDYPAGTDYRIRAYTFADQGSEMQNPDFVEYPANSKNYIITPPVSGDHTYYFSVYTSNGYSNDESYTITMVQNPPSESDKPIISVASPVLNSTSSGMINIIGSTSDDDGPVPSVYLRIKYVNPDTNNYAYSPSVSTWHEIEPSPSGLWSYSWDSSAAMDKEDIPINAPGLDSFVSITIFAEDENSLAGNELTHTFYTSQSDRFVTIDTVNSINIDSLTDPVQGTVTLAGTFDNREDFTDFIMKVSGGTIGGEDSYGASYFDIDEENGTFTFDWDTTVYKDGSDSIDSIYVIRAEVSYVSGTMVNSGSDFVDIKNTLIVPRVLTVNAVSNNSVKIVFSMDMSKTSVENISNYSIDNGLSVNAALRDSTYRYVVYLTTSVQTSGDTYNLIIGEVLSTTGQILDSESNSAAFTGFELPLILNEAVSDNLTQIRVIFNKTLDVTSAETPANYSADGGLSITGAEMDINHDNIVILTTSAMTADEIYLLTAIGVLDSDGGSILASYDTAYFFGVDVADPFIDQWTDAGSIAAGPNITIDFSESMNQASVENISNYTVIYSGAGTVSITGISYNTSSFIATLTVSYAGTSSSEIYSISPSSSITDSNSNPLIVSDSDEYTIP